MAPKKSSKEISPPTPCGSEDGRRRLLVYLGVAAGGGRDRQRLAAGWRGGGTVFVVESSEGRGKVSTHELPCAQMPYLLVLWQGAKSHSKIKIKPLQK